MNRIRSERIATRVTPATKRQLDAKVRITGVPLSEVLRRAAILWLRGDLDLSQGIEDPDDQQTRK